jgi:hypothetical protein
MLPALNCLTALAFKRPSFLMIGVRASSWYCEKDQSFGLTGEGELSKRMRRREWKVWCRRRALEKPRPAAKRGVRRCRKALGERMREAIVV